MGKTSLDYVSCISEAFNRISEESSYYRRILLLHKPKGTVNYKAKMEKRLGVTLKQSYVNRITTMLNSGMIPPENSDIAHKCRNSDVEESKLGWLLEAVLQSD